MTRTCRILGRGVSLAFLFLSGSHLRAASPRIATTASAKDFLAGEAFGTVVTSDGRLTLGIPFGPRAWPDDASDAVVFGAVSDAAGRVFVATGGGRGRLFVSGSEGSISLLFTAPEPNITAVATAPDGTVICATSPHGRVYRIDPTQKDPLKAGTDIGFPSEAAIWALAFAPDGTLYVGTGNKGRIYRRKGRGNLGLFHEIEDVHVRTLAVGRDGTVYAGTSDKGLVVAITAEGVARTLHDFGRPEVVGLAVAKDGTLFAAATSAEPSPLGAGSPDLKPRATPPPTAPPGDTPKGSVTVTTGPARLLPAPKEPAGKELGSEIVAIAPDGFVEPAWVLSEETIYSLRYDVKRDELFLSTGPRGRVYSWRDRHLRLEKQTEQKQVVSAPAVADGFAAVTMNSAGVFRRKSGTGPRSGTYVSAVKDAGRLSLFSRLRFEGEVPKEASAVFSARSGNSEKPDGTWSPWIPIVPAGARPNGGTAVLPTCRFLQWKVELTAAPDGRVPTLERVEIAYLERNARPIIENVTVLEPGAVFPRAGASPSAVLSLTNPDENGIYAGLEFPRDLAPEGPGKKLYRKGFRTVVWKGTDPNGDSLRYDLEGRREESTFYFPLRRELEETHYSFDSSALPDGRYRFRVTGSDKVSNPEGQAQSASEESAITVIDNTAPVLEVESKKRIGEELEIRFVAVDALSPVVKAEWSLDADRWRLLASDDGVLDSLTERFSVRLPQTSSGILAVRVLDAAGNASVASVDLTKDAR
jgi:hypothetical protein